MIHDLADLLDLLESRRKGKDQKERLRRIGETAGEDSCMFEFKVKQIQPTYSGDQAKKYRGGGKRIGLGSAREERDSRLPNLPTLKEQGINVVTGVNRGVFAPKGTPDGIQAMFEKAFAKALKDPDVVNIPTAPLRRAPV